MEGGGGGSEEKRGKEGEGMYHLGKKREFNYSVEILI